MSEECAYPANSSERLFILLDNVSLLFVACCLLSLLTTIILLIFERLQLSHDRKREDQDEQAISNCKPKSNVDMTQRLEASLTEEQKQKENKAKRDQLHAIFNLLQSNGEKFGIQSMDELEEQMKLYSK